MVIVRPPKTKMDGNPTLVPTPNDCRIAIPHSRIESAITVKIVDPQVKFMGHFK
jgi:hypothetical protein